jgi:hypothetical protein
VSESKLKILNGVREKYKNVKQSMESITKESHLVVIEEK